tara:strand:- start:386 stop:628 length:243 start_codon:yes stop_codon:yes gene_type:complete
MAQEIYQLQQQVFQSQLELVVLVVYKLLILEALQLFQQQHQQVVVMEVIIQLQEVVVQVDQVVEVVVDLMLVENQEILLP